MKEIFRALLIIAVVVMGFGFRAKAQNGGNALVLDVYSITVPSDVVHEKGFALWRA